MPVSIWVSILVYDFTDAHIKLKVLLSVRLWINTVGYDLRSVLCDTCNAMLLDTMVTLRIAHKC